MSNGAKTSNENGDIVIMRCAVSLRIVKPNVARSAEITTCTVKSTTLLWKTMKSHSSGSDLERKSLLAI